MKGSINELALFAGSGGGLLGSILLGWRTVCAVEIEEYPREVLLQRQRDGHLEPFPLWDDVSTFDGRPWRGSVDVVSGGFPCQDISAAGKGRGLSGSRSGLVFEMLRIVEEVRPRFVFAENSPMLRTRGLGTILEELDRMGYDAKWCVLGARHVGAPHKRNRMWILANARGRRCSRSKAGEVQQSGGAETLGASDVADTDEIGRHGRTGQGDEQTGGRQPTDGGWWTIEPDVGRVADGISKRVDRLKALGNGQVPAVAALAWHILSSI